MIQEYLNSQSNSFSRSFPNHNSLMSSFTENACEFYQYYIIIMRRHARKNTIFGITGSDSDFGLLQSKKLTNVRSCLKKGYEGATLTEQNGLL